jgi:hypothetical protein
VDRGPSVSATDSVPRRSAPRGSGRSATVSSGAARGDVRMSKPRRRAADHARKLRSSNSNNGLRVPSSRSNRHRAPRQASYSRLPAAGDAVAAAAARGTTLLRLKARRSSKMRAFRIRKARARSRVRTVRPATNVARARTGRDVRAVHDRNGLLVQKGPNGPKVVRNVLRQRIVLRLRKAPPLPPMPRRASAAVSVAAVVAVGVVVAKAAVRRKANRRLDLMFSRGSEVHESTLARQEYSRELSLRLRVLS